MLYYGKIDISEEINIDKTNASKMRDLCHYWYFINKGFMFQPNICNRDHDLLLMSMNLSHIYILNIKNMDYCCAINGISKSEAIKVLQNIYSTERGETL